MNIKAFAIALIVCLGIGFALDAPVITSPADGAVISTLNFNIIWNPNGANCFVVYENDTILPATKTNGNSAQLSVDGDGSYKLQIQGDTEACPPDLWDGPFSLPIIITIDTIVNSVGQLSPTTATTGTSAQFSSQVTDANGITSCILLFGSQSLPMSITSGDNKNGAWSATYSPPTAGGITTKVTCTDIAGNIKETITTVTVSAPAETVPPTVSITSPSNGATVNETITITATASDNVGVAKVEFYVGGTLKSTATSSPYAYSWDTTAVTNGQYSIIARAYDGAGNNAAATATVTVDNHIYVPPVGGNSQENQILVYAVVCVAIVCIAIAGIKYSLKR